MLNTRYRHALLEDLFVAHYGWITDESNLRAIASWFFTCNIFMDETVRELWSKDPRGHSLKGEQAMRDWLALNACCAGLDGNLSVATSEGDNAHL